MKSLFSREGRQILQDICERRVLVAFDFDGTLAPIVRDPDAAAMRKRTAALLATVARRYPCVVISGRARADVMTKVAAIPLRAVLGNHGMEPWAGLAGARRLVARWRRQLAGRLPAVKGVVLDDKGPSLAIHYRRAEARAEMRRRILAAVADLPRARVLTGKMVVNVLPVHAPNKGTAVVRLCRRLRCEATIYVGDDDNDEDAFALATKASVLGIRVGRSRRSHARYYLPRQRDVDALLAALVMARQPGAANA
jgi:trehalose 6-phosphate phosphatase